MILITGATGKVGSDLVARLIDDGQAVRALVRDPNKAAGSLPPSAELSRGDLLDGESMRAALEGVDRMFLMSPPDQRMLEMETSALSAAREKGVMRLVKLSAIGADAESRSFFSRQHGQMEQRVRESGIAYMFLRPNFYMQNILGLSGMIKSQGAIYQPAGAAAASYVDTRDIASVAAKTLTSPGHEGKTYMLTGPQSLTQTQLAEILSRLIGKPIGYVDVPRQAGKKAMLDMGMPEWQAEAISQLMDDLRDGLMTQVSDDVHLVTGQPPRTFEQFARENWSAFVA